MSVPLTLAIGPYDHVRDLAVEGVELTVLHLPVEEIFFRFTAFREWEVSELSLARYVALRGSGDDSLTAVPVFPSRKFRHSALYVRAGAGIASPADLAGRRVGVPEWAQTATVWVRGLLAHEYGVDLASIDWRQGGVNEPGRREGVELSLPAGITITPERDRSLDALLRAGELDAIISARPPAAFSEGRPEVVRLFPDHSEEEERSYRATGIFPIMHVLALRADVHSEHPWVAGNLLAACEAAKRRSLARALDVTVSHTPIPFASAHAQRMQALFGEDPWPYGVEANRTTLEAFLAFAREQGLAERELSPEDLFAPETLRSHRV